MNPSFRSDAVLFNEVTLAQVDLKAVLVCFFQVQAEVVIGNPSEMKRPQGRRNGFVGPLSGRQTLNYWLLVMATPFRGRAISLNFFTYSAHPLVHRGLRATRSTFGLSRRSSPGSVNARSFSTGSSATKRCSKTWSWNTSTLSSG